jgi:phage gpG-like protein
MSRAVTVVGGDRLARTLRTAADDLRHMSDAHRAAGDEVARNVRQRSRRRTGRLAASFTVTVADDGASVGSGLVYAGVQEYGWRRRNISPSYALRGGLDASVGAVGNIYLDAVEDAIGKVKGK